MASIVKTNTHRLDELLVGLSESRIEVKAVDQPYPLAPQPRRGGENLLPGLPPHPLFENCDSLRLNHPVSEAVHWQGKRFK